MLTMALEELPDVPLYYDLTRKTRPSLLKTVLRIRIRDQGSGIRDRVLFDPWIRDPE